MEAGKSYALVVFGGDKESEGLAADFAKLGTKFNSDGYSLTCLSGINLREVMKVIGGPITFGRDDLTGEELVYSKKEPSFYEVVTMNFKERVLDWVKTKASLMTGDDCMIVILIAHGSRRGLIGLETAQGYEYLTVNEMSEALNTLPRDTRLLLVNEACYSGSWIAATSGLTNAVLFEAASSGSTVSHNHRSASGIFRCSYFGYAFVSEITTYATSEVKDHRRRVIDLMKGHSPDPVILTSTLPLDSQPLTHWVLQGTTTSVATTKDPSATTSTTTSVNRSTTTPPKMENSFDDGDDDDKKLINDFVNSTDPDRKTISHSGLISQAQRVLDGKGNQETKQLVIDAIQFRIHQDLVVRSLLMRLFNRNLLIEIYCRQCVDKELNEFGQSGQEAVISINEQLWQVPRVRGLVSLPGLFIHYEEAYDCLLTNVALNSLRHDVDVEGVVTHIRFFFQEDEPEEVEEIE